MFSADGRHVHTEGDSNWWLPSGRTFLSPNPADTALQEFAFAQSHFFLPHRFRDPFHTNAISTETFVTYDARDLLVLETRDAAGNRVTAGARNAANVIVTPSGSSGNVLTMTLVGPPSAVGLPTVCLAATAALPLVHVPDGVWALAARTAPAGRLAAVNPKLAQLPKANLANAPV